MRKIGPSARRAGLASSTVLLAGCLVAALAPPASAYRLDGDAWPRPRVSYFHVAVKGSKGPVARAVKAWNRSGSRLRLVPVKDRTRAKVIVRHSRSQPCGSALASLGYHGPGLKGLVQLPRFDPATPGCDRFWMERLAAHELGHVIGLGHEYRRCSVMQDGDLGRFTPVRCPKPKRPWRYRCRLLEPDDIAGVVRLYGGERRVARRPAICNMYKRITAPAVKSVAVIPPTAVEEGVATVRVRRPASPAIPKLFKHALFSHLLRHEELEIMVGGAGCGPLYPHIHRWKVARGAVDTVALPNLAPGSYCIKARGFDKLGRKGPASQATFEVPGEPL